MNLLKRICYYIINKEEIEEPVELGIGALVSQDAKRLVNKDTINKDYTEHVYFAWQYLGLVVIIFLFLKFSPSLL